MRKRQNKLRVLRVERKQSSPPRGLKSRWIEYQVKRGRSVLYRYDTKEQADAKLAELEECNRLHRGEPK